MATITSATSTGNWNSSGTWDNGVPGCGDTVYIDSGVTVSITDHVNLDETSSPACSTAMYIEVSGTLAFNSGKKIYVACGSTVYLTGSGGLDRGGGGGSSNLIDVCQSTIWNAGDGNLSGPQYVGSGLPITLKEFQAELKLGLVFLNWTTLSEINNDFFTIERSEDLIKIQEVLFIEGAGNSNEELNYEVFDANSISDLTYYRLKQTDFNGKSSYSNWVAVHPSLNMDEGIDVFPSYVFNDFNLRFNDGRRGLNTIVIVDIKGSILYTENIDVQSNFYVWTSADRPIFHKGLAILYVLSDNKKEEFKLVFN